jgi:hypothetical protein
MFLAPMDRYRIDESSCKIVCLGSPIRRKWIQQGPKLQSRWMPPIENGFNEGWSEQGESQDAADVGLVDLLGCCKLCPASGRREQSLSPLRCRRAAAGCPEIRNEHF